MLIISTLKTEKSRLYSVSLFDCMQSHTLLVRMDWEQSHNLMRSIGKSAIPVLRFFLNLTEELNSISTMIDETTRTLNLTTEVTGEYRCVASNVVGNTTWLVIVGKHCKRSCTLYTS